MGVVIEICVKYPRGLTRMKATDMLTLWEREDTEGAPSGRQGRYMC